LAKSFRSALATSDRVGQPEPGMAAEVVAGLRRRRKRRIREGADRDDHEVRLVGFRVEDLRAAVGTEVEDVRLPVGLVRDPGVIAVAAGDLHLSRAESRLHPEGAPGAALTGETVADGDRKRLAGDLQPKLPAVAGSNPHLRACAAEHVDYALPGAVGVACAELVLEDLP
jgi:hypothetical protein